MTIPVSDRLAIQELTARYAFRCDTARYDGIAELFAEDGVWDESVIGLPVCSGRAAITETFCGVGAAISWLIHLGSNHQITEHDGRAARGTCHLHAEGVFQAAAFRIFGYYADDYVKVGDNWLFARRTLKEIGPSIGIGPSQGSPS